MALELIVEDGTGLSDANSYVSVSFADSYHETRVHSTWDDQVEAETKKKALISATRLIDQNWEWLGFKAKQTQALQFPREKLPDPDFDGFVPNNIVPPFIQNATASLAEVLLSENIEESTGTEGIKSFSLDGVMKVEFTAGERRRLIPEWIASGLGKYGKDSLASTRAVRVIRT